jgi:nucleoside-diphosphate-sugar epimerase
MRVALLGGTRFIGRAIAVELAANGHDLCFVHRGRTEPDDLPAGRHVHLDRSRLHEADLGDCEALVDCWAMTREDAERARPLLPRRSVVLSSADVYRAYTALQEGRQDEPVPLTEESPVRAERYPYRGLSREQGEALGVDVERYEKLDVEEVYRAGGGTVCRLPFVFGEHDPQRREEFVLRRVRAGRTRMPFGSGGALLTRGYVGDVARGVRLALEADADGEVFNLGEPQTVTVRAWAERIAAAAGARLELVTVPDGALPEDLDFTAGGLQPLLLDTSKARRELGFTTGDPDTVLRRSVRWHLEHPPAEAGDLAADDALLT